MNTRTRGMLLGLAGVLCFSFSLPLTRIAVQGLDAADVTILRVFLAGLAATLILKLKGRRLLNLLDYQGITPVAAGVVIGFPLLSAMAMVSEEASAGGVVLAVLPLFTAIAGALLMRERLPLQFWLLAGVGGLLVAGFVSDGSTIRTLPGLLFLFLAAVAAALGYAAGARASLRIPSWEVICRALVLCLPFSAIAVISVDFVELSTLEPPVILSLVYLALVSQLSGFFLWYQGLVLGGVALVSQVQLLQPMFTLLIAQGLLGESTGSRPYIYSVLILLVIIGARKALELDAKKGDRR